MLNALKEGWIDCFTYLKKCLKMTNSLPCLRNKWMMNIHASSCVMMGVLHCWVCSPTNMAVHIYKNSFVLHWISTWNYKLADFHEHWMHSLREREPSWSFRFIVYRTSSDHCFPCTCCCCCWRSNVHLEYLWVYCKWRWISWIQPQRSCDVSLLGVNLTPRKNTPSPQELMFRLLMVVWTAESKFSFI